MQTEHLIAKCQWQSGFDQQEHCVDLQDFFSRWSNNILTEELDQYFTKICPTSQTWRIDTLELELGNIALEDINEQLPKRLHDALDEAFKQLILHNRVALSKCSNAPMKIVDTKQALLDYVHWFLLHGSAPWWYSGYKSPADVLAHQLEHSPESITNIIRTLGTREYVRRRLVWQSRPQQLRQIIFLLEPWQGEFICTTADNLFILQKEKQVVRSHSAQFQQEVWFIILTHLLVERGSLFNTAAFLSSTLEQLARRYKISYAELIQQLNDAVGMLKSRTLINNNFIAAIQLLKSNQHNRSTGQNKPRDSAVTRSYTDTANNPHPDYWHCLQTMLLQGDDECSLAGDRIHIAALIDALARENSRQLAKLVREHAKSRHAQQALIKNLQCGGLERLIQVLAPHEHQFILAHREHSHEVINKRKLTENTLWQIILAYLIMDRGSHFNRRQFVHDTLIAICQQQQLDYLTLLQMLMSLSSKHTNSQRFELFAIFQDLCTQTQKRYATQNRVVLNNGKVEKLLHVRTALASAALSRKLLNSISANELTQLFHALAPWAGKFCQQLLLHLSHWLREGKLPSLHTLDAGLTLPLLIIQTLLMLTESQKSAGSIQRFASFLEVFVGLLQKKTGTSVEKLRRELAACITTELRARSGKSSLANVNAEWLEMLSRILPVPSPVQAKNQSPENDSGQHGGTQYLQHPRLPDIASHILCYGRLPAWLATSAKVNLQQLLLDFISQRPEQLLQLLKKHKQHREFMFRLQRLTSLPLLIDAIGRSVKNASAILQEIKMLMYGLRNTEVAGLDNEGKISPLLVLILEYWREDKWQHLDTSKLLADYCWLLMQQTGTRPELIHQSLCNSRSRLSQKMQMCIENIFQTPPKKNPLTTQQQNEAREKFLRENSLMKRDVLMTNIPQTVNNAGLVLVQSYIRTLFERLKLVDANGFISKEHQRRAVHYLQYIASGRTETEEPWLLLNKLLCGLPLHEPVESHIDISTEEANICHSLINAIIDQWNAIGKSSIDGFRGNWLIREGTLSDNNDHWDLIVAKRAYDLLLNRYPLSYSVIKLPWMTKAIYVTWPCV